MSIIYALLGAFYGLPAWIRWVFVGLSLAVALGFGTLLDTTAAIIVVMGIVAVGVLIGLFWAYLKKRKEKRAAAFGGDLQQSGGVTPGAIADPARRARLDDLRRNFEKGVETFRAAGKNLYDVPWYVIVGEPGAGKTEAIRHSNVGFPPGMQDEFQGVGGTINMNWWFTNDAVILDTAGRLLFEEIEAGTTGEWRVFLEMLKKHRPNCPINGLLLAIPAESLIKDSIEQIQKKSGKIAQQLEVIQRQLDVRFPAYVVITKCDLLNGFREFFDDMVDPSAQQQMMGWSNPDPLDSPFRPELVDEHLHTVVERLRRRRQGLMLDPVARSTERRADEVDRFFSLPHSVGLIGSNLRQYLQSIFVAGMWSVQPLFLRGIYFTSSLREGSALDQELADAIGVDVEALPEGKAWERERAYFLRDLFLEKTFRERGLVTRATNTTRLVMKRRLTLFGAASAGLAVLLGLSWLGYHSLKTSIGTQGGYWARASEQWSDDTWKPIVQRDVGNRFAYKGDEPVGEGESSRSRLLFNDAQLPLDDFHQRLFQLASQPLNVSFVFRPLARFGVEIDRNRKRAQRVMFEDGVIAPLTMAARAKMAAPEDPNASAVVLREREGDALLALIRLEANIVKRREKRFVGTFNGEKYLPPLFRYVSDESADPELAKQLDKAYANSGESGVWPPDWLSGGLTLDDNTAINTALNRFITDARRASQMRLEGLQLIIKAIEELRAWQQAEDELYAAANAKRPVAISDREVFQNSDRLVQQKAKLADVLAQAKKAHLFDGGPMLLSVAYERIFRELRARYDRVQAIEGEIDDLVTATTLAAVKKAVAPVAGEKVNALDGLIPDKPDYIIFREIREKLKGLVIDLQDKLKGTLSETEVAELRQLDEKHMADAQSGALHHESRWYLYDRSIKAAPDPNYAPTVELIGQQWKPLVDSKIRIPQIRAEVDGYSGVGKEKVQVICRYCLSRAERELGRYYAKGYLVQVKQKLGPLLRFPLAGSVADLGAALKPSEVVPAVRIVEHIKEDLDSPVFQQIDAESRIPLVKLRQNLNALDPVIKALLTPDKQLRLVTVSLMARSEQLRLSPQVTAMETYKQTELRVGTIDHATPVLGGPQRVASESPTNVELGKFELFTTFHFHFFRTAAQGAPSEFPAPLEWTALRLLDQRSATRMSDGKRWEVSIPAPGTDKLLWFEFRFDAPLPEFDDWPKKTILDVDGPPTR